MISMKAGSSHPQEAIKVDNVSFTYRHAKEAAVKQLDLKVSSGEMIAIAGHTGAGKSTLCMILNGIIPHFTPGKLNGKILVAGKDTAKYEPRELSQFIGVVFQDFETQLFTNSVEQEVAFGPENMCLSAEVIRDRVTKYLSFVGLQGMEKKPPALLSGGEKQRLAIAAVLAMEPDIICLDEPTSDLDPAGKKEIMALVKKLQKERRKTLILIEHETEELLNADRVLVMQQGQIKGSGQPGEILSDPDYLLAAGIRPLPICEAFSRKDTDSCPLTLEEGVRSFAENKFSLDEGKYAELLKKDQERVGKYGPPVLELRQVNFSYDDNWSLKNIDLSVRQGEFLAVLGQNGSGKTTLIKHLNGLLMPASGAVLVKGLSTRNENVRSLSGTVGYVFQNPDHQIIMETVYDDVAFGPRFAKLPEEEVLPRTLEALAAVKLTGYERRDPATLTKGQRQKVAVAAVLANKPEIIVFDEPTTGLDYHELRGMMEMISHLNAAGHTVIMVTHCMWIAAEYAHRVVVMSEGSVVLDGTAREVFGQPETLSRCHLQVPPVTALAQKFGKTILSVPEFTSCLIKS
jgi:energy-coupling factor transport system ATP-binding protein